MNTHPTDLTDHSDLLPVGTLVHATAISSWGEGRIVRAARGETTPNGEPAKPYTVRRADGRLGYFHEDQIHPS